MVLLLHILIALTSIVYATYLFMAPTKAKFSVSYGLVALTVASGTYLVMLHPSHMVQACLSGMLYISVVLLAIILARHKLAAQNRY